MKNLSETLIPLLKKGFCTPKLLQLARKTNNPSTTVQYNIKKLEKEKVILTYKAIFDYKKINQGHCVFLLLDLSNENYNDPEIILKKLVKNDAVESVDICTGEYGVIIKIRTENIDAYYAFLKWLLKLINPTRTVSLTSLKQLKSDFIECV